MTASIVRDFCPRCAIKHLGQAAILLREAKMGYPHHVWYACAHMAEAADEIVDRMPNEANIIRNARVRLERSLAETAGRILYLPDFSQLMYLVAHGGLLEEVTQTQGEGDGQFRTDTRDPGTDTPDNPASGGRETEATAQAPGAEGY